MLCWRLCLRPLHLLNYSLRKRTPHANRRREPTQPRRLQFDHPAGFAGQAPFAGAAPSPATGWTNVPTSHSPAQEMVLRVIDFGTEKYNLNAFIYDSTDDAAVNYDHVLLTQAPAKDGSAAVGDLAEGEWADVKVTVVGGDLAGRTAGMLVKVERLASDLSEVRLFHSSVTRGIATWPTTGPPRPTSRPRSRSPTS